MQTKNYLTPRQEALARVELRKLRQTKARLEQSLEKASVWKEKYQKLDQENQLFKQTILAQGETIEILKLQIEELQKIIYGRRGKNSHKKKDQGNDDLKEDKTERKKADRKAHTYRRELPSEEEVTETTTHSIDLCPDCGGKLSKKKVITRYVEDLISLEEIWKRLKRVEKQLITSGYCGHCKKWKHAKKISPQMVSLGKNVRKFVTYQTVPMRASFQQVRSFLGTFAHLKLAKGEIARILQEEAEKLKGAQEDIENSIRRKQGAHYDETSWPVQGLSQGDWAWVKADTIEKQAVFLLGRSRGKGNAKELKGEFDANQVGITDGYPAYKNIFRYHQLCFAHPYRKLRDLKESNHLGEDRRRTCEEVYLEFGELYQELKEVLATPYKKKRWRDKRKEFIEELREIATKERGEMPEKLKTILASLNEDAEKYFTCLLFSGIPPDNNKAERCLRHLVLKRRISYGSRSQRGAEAMATLFSVLLSLWWKNPDNFFQAYARLSPATA